MKTKKLLSWGFLALSLGFASCSDDITPEPSISIASRSGSMDVMQFDTLELSANIQNQPSTTLTYAWRLDGTQVSTDKTYRFTQTKAGEYALELIVTDGTSTTFHTTGKITVSGRFGEGAFLLNEGNFGNETGTLTYIDAQRGIAIDSVYFKVNDGSRLGNVCQDLFIADGKLYIISQNGAKNGGEGLLTIADAKTLKKIKVVSPDGLVAKTPTHIAVIDGNAYIRAANGISVYTADGRLKLISGTANAAKNRMVAIGKKLYAITIDNKVLVIEGNAVSKTIDIPGKPSGIVKTNDGNLWLSYTSPNTICKISATNNTIVASHGLAENIGAGWGAIPAFGAKGNDIYFSNATTSIYKHDFAHNTTAKIIDVKDIIADAKINYNSLAVDPVSGDVYFASIKGWGDYKTNNTTIFTFNNNTLSKKWNFEKVNSFPAGVFFTADFK